MRENGGKNAGWLSMWSLILVPVVCLFFHSAAPADEDPGEKTIHELETMTVTAHKQARNIRDIPDSMTTFNALELEDASIFSMDSLAFHVPNLEFYNFGGRRHSLTFMRGVKSLHSGEPATGFYVDGVNYSKSFMFSVPLFDVERIEVLKGPQGTLYGRNTMGGVINVHTKKPDNETALAVGSGVGNYNLFETRGYVRAPLVTDKLFFGLSAMTRNRDGYTENHVDAPGEEGRHLDGKAGRLNLRFTPADPWDISFCVDGQEHDDGAFPFYRTIRNSFVKKGVLPADETGHYSHDFESTEESRFWGMSLNARYKTPVGILTAITGFRDYDDDEDIDTDFSPLDMMRMNYARTEKAWSQEFRMASHESETRFRWVAGAYFFTLDGENDLTYFYRSKMANNPNNPFKPGTGARLIDTETTNSGAALFGQASYFVFQDIELTLGLRGEYEDTEMDMETLDTPEGENTTFVTDASDSNDFSAFLPKVSAAWHVAEDHMLYATIAKGQRSGGFVSTAPAGKTTYDAEHSWVYEIGAKSGFFNNKLTMDLSGFYMDITDEQITLFDTASNQSYIDNAGESHRVGLEAQAGFSPLAGLNLSAGITVLDAEYDQYEDPDTGEDYKGRTVFGVPEYTFNLALQYRRPLSPLWSLFSRVELSGVGNRYFDDANSVEGDPYELVNLKLGLEGESLDAYLWAKNLMDKHYVMFENVKKGIAEDGEPLTMGLTVLYRF